VGHGRLQGIMPDRLQFYINRGSWRRALDMVGKVDAYYCHSPEAALRVSQFGCGAPIALHIHGHINAVGQSRFTLGRSKPVGVAYERFVLIPAIRSAQAVFATVADQDFAALMRRHEGVGARMFIRAPAMVTPRRPIEHKPASGKIQLVCVGRLEPIKGVDLVIQAVAVLKSKGIPCKLHVVGDGSGRGTLERLASSLGVTETIRFTGALPEEEVQAKLSAADVFVSGSHQEGFSLALLEALAQGLPAVVTDVGSARDVVRDGQTGFVLDSRDPECFAEAVIKCAAAAGDMREPCVEAAKPYSSRAVSGMILNTLSRIAGDQARSATSEWNATDEKVTTGSSSH